MKTLISLGLSICGGFFTSTLATEISKPEGMAWLEIPSTVSFWLLLGVLVLTFLFHRYMHSYETSVSAFQDAEYCMAYARSELIPAQIEASKREIDNGNYEQFDAAMQKIKDALK
ncbi:hypothetical protein [Palleronia marisminoris]|nr:hypothetical protein [Palleronia marisminoris]